MAGRGERNRSWKTELDASKEEAVLNVRIFERVSRTTWRAVYIGIRWNT